MSGWEAFVSAICSKRYGDMPSGRRRDEWPCGPCRRPPATLEGVIQARFGSELSKEEAYARRNSRHCRRLPFLRRQRAICSSVDIILIDDERQLERLKSHLANQAWISGSPALVVFCANNRRQRLLHEMRGPTPSPMTISTHFFNASVDAAIVSRKLYIGRRGCWSGETCPISAIRKQAG